MSKIHIAIIACICVIPTVVAGWVLFYCLTCDSYQPTMTQDCDVLETEELESYEEQAFMPEIPMYSR